MREIRLPSGSKLVIQLAPFADANALYKAMLAEAKGLKLDATQDIDVNFFKDVFCVGFSSDKIEACVWKCMERVTIDGLKPNQDTFESEKARGDYTQVLFEVTLDNVTPFTKNLYAQLKQTSQLMQNVPA